MKQMILMLVLGLGLSAAQAADDLPTGVIRQKPYPAPALKLSDMDGNVTDIRKLRGQWLLVHFWASWCGPCRRELPSLAAVFKHHPERLPRLLMVNTAETEDEVFAFLGKVAPDLVTLQDKDGQVTERWKPRGLPASYFVDPQGRVRYQALGGRPWESPPYRRFLESLKAGKAP